jgi:nitrogenase molybdenum-iron protein NifN
LQVNPVKLSQPMGATLAFLGIDRCMPLMHGGQGCTSFTKVYFTRHFCEPIAIQTSAVTDAFAVLDGGDYSIVESVKNITQKVAPSLFGLHTTGLPETKGDDIRGVARQIDFPLVYVNTPDYEGGLESGWALACKAIIDIDDAIVTRYSDAPEDYVAEVAYTNGDHKGTLLTDACKEEDIHSRMI